MYPFYILTLLFDNSGNKKSYKILNYKYEIQTGQKKLNECFLLTVQESENINEIVFKTTNFKKNYNGCNTE